MAKRRRSTAQRAATSRMLAANNSGSGRRKSRRSSGGGGGGRSFSLNSVTDVAKNGAIGGAGALGIDVLMGILKPMLPDTMNARIDAAGQTNWLYYAVKAGLAVGVGVLGKRVLPGDVAARMGEGAMVVMTYEIMRGMMPSSVTLGRSNRRSSVGFVNPARVIGSTARIVDTTRAMGGAGRIVNIKGMQSVAGLHGVRNRF